jgi:hypothetical protein
VQSTYWKAQEHFYTTFGNLLSLILFLALPELESKLLRHRAFNPFAHLRLHYTRPISPGYPRLSTPIPSPCASDGPHTVPPSALLRWRSLKDIIRRLRLPGPLLDPKDLGVRLAPLLGVLQQGGADDDLVAHDVLVVVGVGGAGGAVEAIN